MTNVSGSKEKVELRKRLFAIGVKALEKEGWTVTRVQGVGKSSVRQITKGSERRLVSIRTTQDTWLAFPRDDSDTGWVTLSDVDHVAAVSVDDQKKPRFALVHFIDGAEMRDRFDRAYDARKAAGHSIPIGRGVWLALYQREARDPVHLVGAGAGLAHPPIARVPLTHDSGDDTDFPLQLAPGPSETLTIAEAKRRLALTFGVSPSSVKITIEA